MKKIASLVTAGALLLGTVGVVFAHSMPSSDITVRNNQTSHQPTISVAVANSGLNGSFMPGMSMTGAAFASSTAASVGNEAIIGVGTTCTLCSRGDITVANNQTSHQLTLSGAVANSGLNHSGFTFTGPASAISGAQSLGNWATITVVH